MGAQRALARRLPRADPVAARPGRHVRVLPVGGAPTWLPVPDGWGAHSVEAAEADPASTLHLCRAALALRRRMHVEGVLGADDAVTWDLDGDARLVARRGRFALVVAMGDGAVPLPAGEVLLASAPLAAGQLPRTPPPGSASGCSESGFRCIYRTQSHFRCIKSRRTAHPPTCTTGRRLTSGSAWRSTSRVTGAVSPWPNRTYRARCASGLPSDHWKYR